LQTGIEALAKRLLADQGSFGGVSLRPGNSIETVTEKETPKMNNKTEICSIVRWQVGALLALCCLVTGAVQAVPISHTRTLQNVDYVVAGVSGVGGGTGTITIAGISGTVTNAYLYWHGINNSGTGAVYNNPTVTINGNPVTGVALGDATTNCWGAGSSRAFEADVTAFVAGNGPYTIAGLSSCASCNANGASLVVVFDDGNPTNGRDLAFFTGNDSNNPQGFPGETNGWHAVLTPILYAGGPVKAIFHVADGQSFVDNSITFTTGGPPLTIPDSAMLWDGISVPSAGTSRATNGNLWDIHALDITAAFGAAGPTTLNLDGQDPVNDCLSLVVMLLDLEPFSAPPPPTPTPTPPPTVAISGTVIYCPNSDPVPDVTMSLTGPSPAPSSTPTDAFGNYTLANLTVGGSYTVTPSKAPLPPGSAGINVVDVIAAQRHYLTIGLIPPGCSRTAADVTGDTRIDTSDVVAINRFFLGQPFGTANVGKYDFTPAARTYPAIASNQTGQDYVALVFGDIVAAFVHRPEGASQTAAGGGISASQVPAPVVTVATLSLPNVTVDAVATNFIGQVTTTAIDAKNKLVGFQGDFTFDERVVSFRNEPVRKAGITGGNWNVSGNVLAGPGPIRTLRLSAYSNDFTPLSGSGTLFELNMTRVSKAAQGTPLLWAAANQFIFIDADLNTQKPGHAAPGSVTTSGKALKR
jgi:hypothetical protein